MSFDGLNDIFRIRFVLIGNHSEYVNEGFAVDGEVLKRGNERVYYLLINRRHYHSLSHHKTGTT